VLEALSTPRFRGLHRVEAPVVDTADLLRAHTPELLALLREALPADRWAALDADTFLSPGSLDAAFRAAGAACLATDMVLAGDVANAFCAVRPPGHHAERDRAMGFCLFNSIAIAALRALDHHGLARVAVVDFDVHHGNGTQDILWDEARALYVSTHQMPLYPGTGDRHETGAHGNIINVPLPPGTGGAAFRQAMEAMVLPALEDFAPDLLLISAGFDAHADDPLAQMALTEADFAWVTGRLCDIADRHCGGRVVSALEGGYNLAALAAGTAAHVEILMERGA